MANRSTATVPEGPQPLRRDAAAWELVPPPPRADLGGAEAYCREVARRHYENFTVATRLVPGRLRQHLANVYAFARWSDDLADEQLDPSHAAAGLAEWRRGLEECFAGRPGHPIYVALAETARRTGVTIEPFASLLDAFEEDAALDAAGAGVRYADRVALTAYCHRSADPVGRIVLALEGCGDAERVAMSDAICTGLQLVNFWQDIRRDRQAGRIYLPGDDMARHGVTVDMLDLAVAPAALRRLVHDEVSWARERFCAGAPLAETAPPVLRPAIGMFLAGGRAVADAIEGADYDTLSRRPTVGRLKRLSLAARAWWRLTRVSWHGRGGRP
jgi:squalene synthase HpnC